MKPEGSLRAHKSPPPDPILSQLNPDRHLTDFTRVCVD